MKVKKYHFILGARSYSGELMMASDETMLITTMAIVCLRDSFFISIFFGYWVARLSFKYYENVESAIWHAVYFAITVCSSYLYKFIKFTKDYKSGVAALEKSSNQVLATLLN